MLDSDTNIQSQSPVSSQLPPQKPNFFDSVNTFLSSLKVKIEDIIHTRLKLVILVAVLIILLIIVGFIVLNSRKVIPKPIKPTPTPLPAVETILNPSRYATDEGVLKIESEIKKIDENLGGADLREDKLNPPEFNFDINFVEK